MFFFSSKAKILLENREYKMITGGSEILQKKKIKKNTKPLEEAEFLLGNDNLYQMSTKK